MLEKSTSRFQKLSRSRLLTKYAIYFFLALLTVTLCAQLVVQLYTVNNFEKSSGIIAEMDTKLTSYNIPKSRFAKGNPVYSRIVSFNNKKTYTLPSNIAIKKGDTVALYYPSLTYRILSLEVFDSENYPLQIAVNNREVKNFKAHQQAGWKSVYYLIGAIALFCYFLYDWYRN